MRSFARKKRVVLASGRESDFFIDCKQTVLTAEGHALVGELMFDALAALPALRRRRRRRARRLPARERRLARELRRAAPRCDAIYVRKDAKDHGSKRLARGRHAPRAGRPLVILEDVITTGGSTLKAAEKLRAAGYRVVGVVALVDRLEGGREAIEAAGLRFVAIYTRRDFIPD